MNRKPLAPRRNKQGGFTLIEALVVLIVGVTILAASAAGIGSLFRHSEIATEASNLLLMQDRLRDLSNGKEYYTGINNKLAIRYKAIPDNMTLNGNQILNSWNGDVNIGATDQGKHYFIDYYKVPAEACQKLVLKLRHSGWERIEINSVAIPANLSLADLGKRCDAGGSNGNKMAFLGGPT